jgi:hypothetical protein
VQKLMVGLPGAVDGETGTLVGAPDLEKMSKSLPKLGKKKRDIPDWVKPGDLSEAGWGIVFANGDEKATKIREALQPLLIHRKNLAADRYRELAGKDGYYKDEDKLDFLARQKAGPGQVDPSRIPYYLLLVGSPEQIPYEFQYGLDFHHAVGRICFDSLDEYSNYAISVVAAEKAEPRVRKEVAFFGPLQDEGTELTNQGLLGPIMESLDSRRHDCEVRKVLGIKATKAALTQSLTERPDLLFTAGHGLFYRSGHEDQRDYQGALVCQDWPGPGTPPEYKHLFTADDLDSVGQIQGLLAFLFACNSAGTPAFADFAKERHPAAPQPFVAKLAQKLLSRGGAQAVVGHVEQVWRCSFIWRDTGFQPQAFIQVIHRLLDGEPLGWAMEPLADRFADLVASLYALQDRKEQGYFVDEEALAALRTASRDARNYIILGDPAVRLRRVGKKRVLRG